MPPGESIRKGGVWWITLDDVGVGKYRIECRRSAHDKVVSVFKKLGFDPVVSKDIASTVGAD